MAPHAADQLRMAEGFWLREDVQLAIRARDVGAVFRILQKFGISQSQIGIAVGLEQGAVNKVINGRRGIVSHVLLERIADGVAMPDHCRILFGLAPRDVTWQQAMVTGTVTADTGVSYDTLETSGDDPVRRRDFLTLTGAAAIAIPTTGLSILEQVERLRRDVNDSVSHSAVAESGLDDWEQTVLRHGRATRHRPPGALLMDLTNDFAEIRRLLALRQSSSALRRLTRVTAQMAGLMSLTLIKLDARAAARSWARTARLAADEAGDRAVQSWVRAQEAYAHFYSGDFAEAASSANQAQAVAGQSPSVGVALSAALEARALALLGKTVEARDALVRAERALTHLDEDFRGASAFGYNEAQFRFHEGNTFTHLHDTPAAWTAQERALELYPSNDYLDRALIQLDRASCLLHDGDTNTACTVATETLAVLTPEQTTGLIAVRAREILAALPPRQRSSSERELRDLLAISSEHEGEGGVTTC